MYKTQFCLCCNEEIIPTPKFLADFKLRVGDLFSWLKF